MSRYILKDRFLLNDLKGLPYGDALTEESVKDLFAEHGQIDSVRLVLDMNTNKPRGQAFVRYVDQKAAEAGLNGILIYIDVYLFYLAMNGAIIPNTGMTKGLTVRYADTAQEKKQSNKIAIFV